MKRFFILTTFIIAVVIGSIIPVATTAAETKANVRGYYVIDSANNTVMESCNADSKQPIASMVKIMTLLLAYECAESGNLQYDESIEISQKAKSMGGSQMFLDCGLSYKTTDLLLGITIASANDASVAIAERIAGSEQSFVTLMNERAKSLNMNNTHFDNCTGLPSANGYSTAKDVAIMFSELIKQEKYFEFSKIWLHDFIHPDGRTTVLTNTNKLSRFYKGCDGGKTGYTHESKYCLAATAKRNDLRVIAVCIGAESSKERNAFVSTLFDTAFANCKAKILAKSGDCLGHAQVIKGESDSIEYTVKQDITVIEKANEKSEYSIVFEDYQVKAPIKCDEIIGMCYLTKNGLVIEEIEVVSKNNVNKSSFWQSYNKVLENW